MTRTAPPRRWIARSLALALALGVASLAVGAVSTGCASTCDTSGQDPVVYKQGFNPSPSSYESNDPNGTWLHFPPGRRYRFMDKLGTTNVQITPLLAFDSHPLHGDAGVGNSSWGAGNAVVLEAVTSNYVQIRNDTCAEYWLWVVIRSLDAPRDGGAE